ncbi:hypothetical protein [Candidatus Binatus sp.]|uniref:hypothetical protein n=1 Tax=Candidatus Binatus sp. TaxID=2811406 RepID=UPI002F932B64
MNSEIELRDHVFVGPLRRSVNNARNVSGSIHDDAMATKLGFRGGTVAGSIHLELFPPLLLKAFGQRWFERGTISMYFLNATTDREAVRAFLKEPPRDAADAQVDAWIERDDGMRVAEGTASVGRPEDPTALLRRPLDRFDAGQLRILGPLKAGDRFEECDAFLTKDATAERMKVITDPLEWYTKPSPWGGAIATPATMVHLLYTQSIATLRGKLGQAVGLFGAIELRNINGPVLVERPYRVSGSIVALGQSPKTEFMWFESALNEAAGKRIAEMRMLLRFMKASSPLYKDAIAS